MKPLDTPIATYRLQLHAGFTFADLQDILEYLHTLGISTIYASPIFKSAPGSMHGYDVTDPHSINPAIGSIEELRAIRSWLQEHNMTWLQDIVPNHMAFHPSNARLYDVMERGPLSPYYEYFDIDWQHPDSELAGKLMTPFLGQSAEACIEVGEIRLAVTDQGLAVQYFDTSFPLSISAYDVLQSAITSSDALPIQRLLDELYQQAMTGIPLKVWDRVKQRLIAQHPLLPGFIEKVNSDKQLLSNILQQQYYHLCSWRTADHKINYRRFFTVNELIAVRMELPAVFEEYHKLVHSLYREELIQGLRIDHIDGLYDPEGYIDQLRRLFGSNCYIIAEKILENQESLPSSWAIQGSSGYEFLSFTNHLLTSKKGEEQLVKFYHSMLPSSGSYQDIVYEKKRYILERYMSGELDNLVRYIYTLKLADARINRELLKEALALFMICLPVYRLYPSSDEILRTTFARMRSMNREAEEEIMLLESFWEEDRQLFLRRLMQFTGPLTAKGVEDTTFYVYNALLSHNEVGDSPVSTVNFHQRLAARQQYTPESLNTTSTHDTKRGEDGRLRLNMLSLFPDQWKELVSQRREPNIDPNDEYFIYLSIIAGFPADGVVTPEFVERLQQYMVKALREGKVNSSWSAPDTEYEEACTNFIQQAPFEEMLPFIGQLNQHAFIASLAQALIKITAPGIPDIYQGCELWDYSYVDPDNRRPVNYTLRKQYLSSLIQQEKQGTVLAYITENRSLGMEKLFVTWKALTFRRTHPQIFLQGDYLPLQVSTPDVIAYARVHRHLWVVVVVPLPGFRDTAFTVSLPLDAPVEWKNVFTGEEVSQIGFGKFPVGLFFGGE
ncbi:malto-oligosyltrehalose synthase [Chitinophaga tropicalis]|nr:malto-oligosyltrehalose synthase [Chitinophaga tropicalis]